MTEIESIDNQLSELRRTADPKGSPYEPGDVKYMRLLARKLELGVTFSFNPNWFYEQADKIEATLRIIDQIT